MLRLTLALALAGLAAGAGAWSSSEDENARDAIGPATQLESRVTVPKNTEESIAPTSACYINLSARNESRDDIYLSLSDSKVRMRRGWWAKFKKWRSLNLGFGVFVPLTVPSPPLKPGKRVKVTVQVSHGCNAHRRYRFQVAHEDGATHVIYYPSSRSFTRTTNIRLGDLSRFF